MSPSNFYKRNSCIRDKNCLDDLPRTLRSPLSDSVALLVVDVQPEFWSGCPQVRQEFLDFPRNLEKTIALCRSQNAKIIWVRADYNYECSPWLVRICGKEPHHHRLSSTLTSSSCNDVHRVRPSSQDTWKWEDFATPQKGDIVVSKQKSWSGTHRTGLLHFLREHKPSIDTILVCGIFTSVSVQHTAFGVFEAGFRTLLIEDACADRGKARHEAALALYGNYMYEVLGSRDLQPEPVDNRPELYYVVANERIQKQFAIEGTSHAASTNTMTTSSRMSKPNTIFVGIGDGVDDDDNRS